MKASPEKSINIRNAVKKALKYCSDGFAAWQPVFVDVIIDSKKVGHIVSDGYTHESWSFFPVPELRSQQRTRFGEKTNSGHRTIRGMTLATVLPKWVSDATMGAPNTYNDIHGDSK